MQQGPEQSRRLALGLLFLLVFIWGANWPLMKMALADLPPYWFAVSRFALGCAVLFALLAAKGRLGLPNRRDLPVILTVAWLQMAAFMSLVNTGLLFVDAGRSAILAYTTPLWVTPLSLLWLKEPMTRNKVIGLVLGLGGVLVLFNPGALDWQDPDVVRGNGLLLLAAFCWALAILHVRGHKWQGTRLKSPPGRCSLPWCP